MSRIPYIDANKEMESELGAFRLARGLTVVELCKVAGINPWRYSGLNNGTRAPLLQSGEVLREAQALADFFECELSALFPRYFCEFKRWEEPLAGTQYGNVGAAPLDRDLSLEKAYETREQLEEVKKVLRAKAQHMNLTERNVDIFMLKAAGYSLTEIGKQYKVTKEYVRVLVKSQSFYLRRCGYEVSTFCPDY